MVAEGKGQTPVIPPADQTTTAIQARNQGANLPDEYDGKLRKLDKLTTKKGFRRWEHLIKLTLNVAKLKDVIDPALPRPHYTDAKYDT